MTKEKIEELEEFENLVYRYVSRCYNHYPTTHIDYEFDRTVRERVLYYLKLGLTNADMKLKIEKQNDKTTNT